MSGRTMLHHAPAVAGAGFALAGIFLGIHAWDGAPLPLLGAALALLAGLWAATAAAWAPRPAQRRPLQALALLAPITLLPAPFQPIEVLTALPLLTAAAAFDALWTLSWLPPDSGKAARPRWLWLVWSYGGALALAIVPLPWSLAPIPWAAICLAAVAGAATRRMLHPAELAQESAAQHTLWTLGVAAVVGGVALLFAPGALTLFGAACAAAAAQGLSHAAMQLRRDESSFSSRHALVPLLAAGVLGTGCWLLLQQLGSSVTPAVLGGVVAACVAATPLLIGQTRALLERLPPRAARSLDEAVANIRRKLEETPDLDDLTLALAPLERALPRGGGVALVSFDPDWTSILSDGAPEHRRTGPGAVLLEQLATPFAVRPVLASTIVDRSVRDATLREIADLIDELQAELIVPLPGGPEGALAGALFVGRPQWGRLGGYRGACLTELARTLGPAFRAAVTVELAGKRIGELDGELGRAEDRLEQVEYRLERLSEENRLLRADRAGTAPTEIVGRSRAMQTLLSDIEKAAGLSSDSSLLIRGESGTGRTLVARTIHETSRRRTGPLVQYDCAGTPPRSHVTALVGKTEGALARPGLLELADQGSLLLGEVGALSLDAQAELVRALASGEVLRDAPAEGGLGPANRAVDVRVLATSGRTTDHALASESMLPEVRDRLNALVIDVPPLRERRGDIPELAESFVSKSAKRHGLAVEGLQGDALEALESYDWPGNVRQLRAVVEHATLVAAGGKRRNVTAADLPRLSVEIEVAPPGPDVLSGTLEEIEREALRYALERADGNKTEAARLLGLKRTTFNSRLRKLLNDDEE